jgi:hypothetical protein
VVAGRPLIRAKLGWLWVEAWPVPCLHNPEPVPPSCYAVGVASCAESLTLSLGQLCVPSVWTPPSCTVAGPISLSCVALALPAAAGLYTPP